MGEVTPTAPDRSAPDRSVDRSAPDRSAADRSAPDRERLLSGAVAYAAEHGLAGLSLRRLADALSTTPRVLSYRFGSKRGLLAAVAEAVAQRQRAALAAAAPVAGDTPQEQHRRLWRCLADPSRWPHELLFFEAYSRSLRGGPPAGALVDDWLGPLTELGVRRGLPPRLAGAHARLAIAVHRGLLLDVLATGDRAAVDEAMGLFLRTVTGRLPVPSE